MRCCGCSRHLQTRIGCRSWPPWPKSAITCSRLARTLGISRALLQVHLRRLEAAGLVNSTIEVSEDGKAMKYYEVTPFDLRLTPDAIIMAARTLGADTGIEVEAPS